MDKFNLAADYSNDLIRTIMIADVNASEDEQIPAEILNFWIEEIKLFAEITVVDYLKGDRDTYKFTDSEMNDLWKKAVDNYTQHLLNGLVDKGLVEVSVNGKGDILYGLTEDGKEVAKDF